MFMRWGEEAAVDRHTRTCLRWPDWVTFGKLKLRSRSKGSDVRDSPLKIVKCNKKLNYQKHESIEISNIILNYKIKFNCLQRHIIDNSEIFKKSKTSDIRAFVISEQISKRRIRYPSIARDEVVSKKLKLLLPHANNVDKIFL